MNGRFVQGVAGILAAIGVAASGGIVSADQPARDYYIALGDSLAVGEGATVPDQFGYVGQFKRFWRTNHHGTERFANLAVSGQTSSAFKQEQLPSALQLINDPHTQVQVLTLSLGANDFLPLLASEPCASAPAGLACLQKVAIALGDFAANYQAILVQLNTALAQDPGEGRLLVTTYYNPYDGTGAPVEGPVDAVLLGSDGAINCPANQTDPTKAGVNDLINCIGGQLGAEIVDIYPLFNNLAPALTHITEGTGNHHPNNAGHRAIANAVVATYGGDQDGQHDEEDDDDGNSEEGGPDGDSV